MVAADRVTLFICFLKVVLDANSHPDFCTTVAKAMVALKGQENANKKKNAANANRSEDK